MMPTESMFELTNPVAMANLEEEFERVRKGADKDQEIAKNPIAVGDTVVVRAEGQVMQRDGARLRIKLKDGAEFWAPVEDVLSK
jgi:hypothetical protein